MYSYAGLHACEEGGAYVLMYISLWLTYYLHGTDDMMPEGGPKSAPPFGVSWNTSTHSTNSVMCHQINFSASITNTTSSRSYLHVSLSHI